MRKLTPVICVAMLILFVSLVNALQTGSSYNYLPFVVRDDGITLPTVTPTPTPEDRDTITPTPTTTPKAAGNLLVNPSFEDEFAGWNSVNSLWLIHPELCHENTAPSYAEMDRDVCDQCNTWQVGDEDWLWQDVAAPEHTTVMLRINEAHHMRSGDAILRVYGSDDGQTWSLIWQRDTPDAEFGAGHQCTSPGISSYQISASYPYYRLEFYGRMNEEGDGWLLGGLSLTVD